MALFIDKKKEAIANLITIEGVSQQEIYNLITIPEDMEMGDYALPCFRFAKALRKSPVAIANDLAETFNSTGSQFTATAINGYLNFKGNKLALAFETLSAIVKEGANYATSDLGANKTVCMDYSSVNIAKPFHIGHLSTTVIGGALYRAYKKLGYNAVGINHLGDWGTQFGKLIVAYKMWGNPADIEARGVTALNELYVKFHHEAEQNEELNNEARRYFKLIEDGNEEALELFSLFKKITLKEAQSVYERLDIHFDSYNGEAFYNDKMDAVLDELAENNLIVESEGAKVVDLADYDMPPCLLVKADGATLYATRDLAAAFYRKNTYNCYKSLYIVAYQQNLHFKQVFKVVELMGKEWAKDLIHVPFGMVSLAEGTMSTRKGNVVLLKDVFDRAVEKSLAIITEKNSALQDKATVAEQIGVGAVVFFALSNNRIKDIVFSYDKVLNFEGETGPYVQYTYARCNSILKNLGENVADYLQAPLTAEELEGVNNKSSEALIAGLSRLPAVLFDVTERYEPSILTRYVVNICQDFNRFYLENRILNVAPELKRSRVAVVYAAATVIKESLRILGISAPSEM
ncbi:MAG: arginine--tRNA ligase [Bacillota bacterium]